MLQLARVPPLRVIRRDVGALKASSLAVLGAGALGFAALLLAVSADLKLGLIAVGGFAAAVALFALLSWLAVWLLKRAVPEARAPRWLVLATRQIAARPAFAVLQVSALAVGLLALVLLVLLRTDLIASWRAATPPRCAEPLRHQHPARAGRGLPAARWPTAGVERYDWFPMIRGRLVAINGRIVGADSYSDDRAKRLVEREFNLSHSAELPGHNRVVGGRWRADEADALSVEEGLADDAGLEARRPPALRHRRHAARGPHHQPAQGRLGFDARQLLRHVPDGRACLACRPPPSPPFGRPSSPASTTRWHATSRTSPTVDVSQQIAQVQQMLDQVVRAVEFLFAFTLAAGLVVLFAAVSATRDERAREFAVMRALGAGRQLLAQVQRAELLGVGALAGVLASLAAMVVGWALARYAFEFQWTASWWVPLAGGAGGATLALAAGWWGLREVLRRPVVETLRKAAME